MGTRRAQERRQGFTLIEILAVAAILALVAAFVAPNLGGLRKRALRAEAQRISSQLELARQRAIVTGIPHRLWMDLDEAEFRLEWLADDPDRPARPAAGAFDLYGNAPLNLEAPLAQQQRFQPIPGNFGRLQIVTAPFYFQALDTPEGVVEDGQTYVLFQQDGSADQSRIWIEDKEGLRIALDVYPLDERIRIRDDV